MIAALLTLSIAQTPAAAIDTYFDGELRGASGFIASGLASGVAGGLFLGSRERNDVLEGAAYPVLAVGAVQLIVGVILRMRTPAQVAELKAIAAKDPQLFKREELRRMYRVEQSFRVLQAVELGLTGVGLGLATYGGVDDRPIILGLGVGLVAQALWTLMLDWFAEQRAHVYTDALKGI